MWQCLSFAYTPPHWKHSTEKELTLFVVKLNCLFLQICHCRTENENINKHIQWTQFVSAVKMCFEVTFVVIFPPTSPALCHCKQLVSLVLPGDLFLFFITCNRFLLKQDQRSSLSDKLWTWSEWSIIKNWKPAPNNPKPFEISFGWSGSSSLALLWHFQPRCYF